LGFIIIIVLAAAVVVGGYVYIHGAPGHGGVDVPLSSLNPQDIPGAIGDQIAQNPHIVALAVASGIVAWLVYRTWGKIGNWGRGIALVGLGIFLAYSVGHR